MFLCGIDSDTLGPEELDRAVQGEQQCHEKQANPDEDAWDDVNACPLAPAKQRARQRWTTSAR